MILRQSPLNRKVCEYSFRLFEASNSYHVEVVLAPHRRIERSLKTGMVKVGNAMKSKLHLQHKQQPSGSSDMMEQTVAAREAADNTLAQMVKNKQAAASALDIRWPKLDSVGKMTSSDRTALVFEAVPV